MVRNTAALASLQELPAALAALLGAHGGAPT